MTEKYQPYLIGVAHHPFYVSEVTNAIFGLGVKSVGVEVSQYELNFTPPIDYAAVAFWKKVISNLLEKGIKVVFLKSNSLDRKLHSKMVGGHWGTKKERLEYRTLVSDTMTRFMEKKAIKTKPEALIVGGFHAALMRKDLKISKNKFQIVPLSFWENEWHVTRREIIEARWWQMDRRKAREKRLAKIMKRKEAEKKKTKIRK